MAKLSKSARTRYAREVIAQEKWIETRDYNSYPNPNEVRAADHKYLELLIRARDLGIPIWSTRD